jgi:hypothetical protein
MAYPNRSTLTQRFISSRQLLPGDWANAISDALTSAAGLTALGTTQANAALVNATNTEVLAGSANNAGVKLPAALPGAEINILNNSANSTIVYGAGTDVVQTTGTTYAAAATGITMATLTAAKYFCIKAGFWQRIITA